MFQSAQKQAIFGSVLAFLKKIYVTTLRVGKSGSPRLRITKTGWLEKKGRKHFKSGWEWLTTAAHNQKWLMKTKISEIRGLATKRMQIEYQMIADTEA